MRHIAGRYGIAKSSLSRQIGSHLPGRHDHRAPGDRAGPGCRAEGASRWLYTRAEAILCAAEATCRPPPPLTYPKAMLWRLERDLSRTQRRSSGRRKTSSADPQIHGACLQELRDEWGALYPYGQFEQERHCRTCSGDARIRYDVSEQQEHLGRVSLAGRVAIVTGVSRRAGIGFAIAREFLAAGARVVVQSYAPHDAAQPWGSDPAGVSGVLDALGGVGDRLRHVEADFADPAAPAFVVEAARAAFGHVDALVANHARSSKQGLMDVTADELDLAWAVNARASVLLTQAFAAVHDDRRMGGRVILFTSGQHLAPMTQELPYAVSKGAIHQMTLTLADALADRGITVNTVNPGPVDTGWADLEIARRVRQAIPAGRWGRPEEVAKLVLWLSSDEASWITGQVINSEGGFRRWRM